MALNPQTGLQQFGFFKKIAKKLLKPPGGSKFIKKTLMPPGMKKSLEYSLLPHRALGMSERDLLMPHKALGMSGRDLLMPQIPRGGRGPREGRPPHKDLPSGFNPFRLEGRPIRRPRLEGRPRKDLPKWLQGKFGGIGGLREKLLNVPFFEGRQFPTGIPEQLRQLPLAPPEWDQRMELYQQPAPIPTGIPEQLEQFGHGGTVVPRDPQQPAPINQFGGTVVPRAPVDTGYGWDVDRWLPIAPRLSPEEITQQRIDQVSQFEQEPMMEPRYGAFGGSAMNLPDYTTRTSRYPVVDWETLGPARFADARFDPQRTGYADTGMRSDSGRTYALPGGYADGGIAELLHYYGV